MRRSHEDKMATTDLAHRPAMLHQPTVTVMRKSQEGRIAMIVLGRHLDMLRPPWVDMVDAWKRNQGGKTVTTADLAHPRDMPRPPADTAVAWKKNQEDKTAMTGDQAVQPEPAATAHTEGDSKKSPCPRTATTVDT